jgi:phage FluMu protein Com
MNRNKLLEQIIKDLQSRVKCPVCGLDFAKKDIVFKGQNNGEYSFEFNCPRCSTLLFAKVTVDHLSKNSTTNLSSGREKDKFRLPRRKITSNDIISLHQILEKTKDISKLL